MSTLFGGAIKAHWGLADPSHLDLPKEEKLKAFQVTVDHINRRLDALLALDTTHMSRPRFDCSNQSNFAY